MKINKHSVLAVGIGAVLTLGSVGCSDQRARNTRERNESQTATESSRDKSNVRTDNPEDVGGTSSQGSSSQSGQAGTASGTQAGSTSGTGSGTSSTTTQTERERMRNQQQQRDRNRSGSTSGTTSGTTGGTTPNR